MQTNKMSLANIQGKLSRTEMKNIMAGSGATGCKKGDSEYHCTVGTGYPNAYICQSPASSGGCGSASNCRSYCSGPGGTYWI